MKHGAPVAEQDAPKVPIVVVGSFCAHQLAILLTFELEVEKRIQSANYLCKKFGLDLNETKESAP